MPKHAFELVEDGGIGFSLKKSEIKEMEHKDSAFISGLACCNCNYCHTIICQFENDTLVWRFYRDDEGTNALRKKKR